MIEIDSIDYYQANIPFTTSFKHGSAERSETETIIVEVNGENGLSGYGEGCPRSYVTGESIASAVTFYSTHHVDFKKIHCLHDLSLFVTNNRAVIDKNPAAWCAVELGVLDLLARSAGVNVETLLCRESLRPSYVYSAILGDSSPVKFAEMYEKYREMGFSDFKVKLSSDLSREASKLACLSKDEGFITIRADANNLWSTKEEAAEYLAQLDVSFSAIEEPITSNQLESLELLGKEVGVKVVLDESFLFYDQIKCLKNTPSGWIVNVRVSKMGGLLRSLEIIDELVKTGIQITIGAQVGETSLLTRAALILADASGVYLSAQEGAFGTLLLERDLFSPVLQFGVGGKLPNINELRLESGFGLNLISYMRLDPYMVRIY